MHTDNSQDRLQRLMQIEDPLDTGRKQALDASAPRLRNLFIFVQIFLLYVVVSILGVDDRDLLNPYSTVAVPLPNISLPTIYFFVLAPVLVTLLHINLLLHHQAYQVKLRLWQYQLKEYAQLDLLAPNFFDIAFLDRNPWQRLPVNASLWFLLYFWPPGTLCLALFWFADYQNPCITLGHFILLFISCGASVHFSYRQSETGEKLQDESCWAKNFLLGACFLLSIYLIVFFLLAYYKNSNQEFSNTLSMLSLFSRPWLTTLLLPFSLVISVAASIYIYWRPIYLGSTSHYLCCWSQRSLLIGLPLVGAYLAVLVILLTWFSYEQSNKWLTSNLLYQPNINAPSFVYKDLGTDSLELAAAYESSSTRADLIQHYSRPLDLSKRSLRYANLSASFLPRARLDETDLSGANLRVARLPEAQLGKAYLQGANLAEAHLQGAYFWKAQLEGADLRAARLQGAILQEAQLMGADLSTARLQGADLQATRLWGATFWSAYLHGAHFGGAHLQGVYFKNAYLQGAFLNDAILQGAIIDGTQLHGVQSDFDIIIRAIDSLSSLFENGKAILRLFQDYNSDFSGIHTEALSVGSADFIIDELKKVDQYSSSSFNFRTPAIHGIHRIRAAIGKPWTLEGSGAITGVLTQEMIDEILEQWDD